jgi:hypothetical protein
VADELALMLRDQPYQVRCLVARARRMAAGLPTVWEAFRHGELDAEQMRVIDRVARRVTKTATLAALDEQAVDAAQDRSPKQLQVWLLRLVVQLEPLASAQRHRRALAERRVTCALSCLLLVGAILATSSAHCLRRSASSFRASFSGTMPLWIREIARG